jgi:hypothetical protein
MIEDRGIEKKKEAEARRRPIPRASLSSSGLKESIKSTWRFVTT